MEYTHPTKKRKALAIYFDLILFGIIWVWVSYFLFSNQLSFYSYSIVFIIVEAILLNLKYSPGYYILSIYAVDSSQFNLDIDIKQQQPLIVDPKIKQNETWLTMIMGTLFINSGVKGVERWATGESMMVMFGLEYGSAALIVTNIFFGLASIYLGYQILKLKKSAFLFGLSFIVITSTGVLMSSADFHLMIEAKQRWREMHGAPTRSVQDLNTIVHWFKNAIYISSAGYILLLFVIKKKLIGER